MENIGFLLFREPLLMRILKYFQARSHRTNSASDLRRSLNELQRYDSAEKWTCSRPHACNRRKRRRDYVIKIWVLGYLPAFTVAAGPRDRVIPIGELPKWLPITQIKDATHNHHDCGCNYGCKSRSIRYLTLVDPSQFLDSLNGSSTGAEQV